MTAHGGFCLYDLVAYDQKHNEAYGHVNTDGANDNRSWNCGWEGDVNTPEEVLALRCRQAKNFCALLLLSPCRKADRPNGGAPWTRRILARRTSLNAGRNPNWKVRAIQCGPVPWWCCERSAREMKLAVATSRPAFDFDSRSSGILIHVTSMPGHLARAISVQKPSASSIREGMN